MDSGQVPYRVRNVFESLLDDISNKAAQDRGFRFHGCLTWLADYCLLSCWDILYKNAIGPCMEAEVAAFAANLEANLQQLQQQVRLNTYRPGPGLSRRIPRSNGRQRILATPGVGDRLLQIAVSRILTAIYRCDFLPDCHGVPPGRAAYNPVATLSNELLTGRYRMLVEVSLHDYLALAAHDTLLRMLGRRIADRAFLTLIGKWLQTGAERGGRQVSAGIPQGEYVTPVLGNIYLHYLLDVWLRDYLGEYAQGAHYFCRYSYDAGCALVLEADAEHVYRALSAHLERHHLLHDARLRLWRLQPA